MELTKENLRDIFVKEAGRSDAELDFELLSKHFDDNQINEILERGWAFEPLLGKFLLIEEKI